MLVDVNDAIETVEIVKRSIYNDPHFGDDMNITNFIKHMSMVSPQSYGVRIEKRVARDLCMTQISAKENKGDMKDFKNRFFELKSSLITNQNPFLNMVQLRLWQNVNYYLCIGFDIRNLNRIRIYPFLLTKKQMEKEITLMNFSNAHGTLKSLENNENVEIRYSLKIDKSNEDFNRWMRKYYRSYTNLMNYFKQ